jgi:hypothetical protein
MGLFWPAFTFCSDAYCSDCLYVRKPLAFSLLDLPESSSTDFAGIKSHERNMTASEQWRPHLADSHPMHSLIFANCRTSHEEV